jgi:hypothetical protein
MNDKMYSIIGDEEDVEITTSVTSCTKIIHGSSGNRSAVSVRATCAGGGVVQVTKKES